jgi:hypothetical protein
MHKYAEKGNKVFVTSARKRTLVTVLPHSRQGDA